MKKNKKSYYIDILLKSLFMIDVFLILIAVYGIIKTNNESLVSFDNNKVDIYVGEKYVPLLNNQNNIDDYTFEIEDSTIASIDNKTGEISGLKIGKTFIYLKDVDNIKVYDKLEINVINKPVTTIEVESLKFQKESLEINVKDNIKLNVIVNPTTATNKQITWSSSDSNIVKVDASGTITGITSGTASVTAKSNNGKVATIKVTVKPLIDKTKKINATVYPVPKSANISSLYYESFEAKSFNLIGNSTKYQKYFSKYNLLTDTSGIKVNMNVVQNLAEEEYKINIANNEVNIQFSTDFGAFYAISTLSKLIDNNRLPKADITDYPSVKYRGVIEGFYGNPWSNSFRIALMEFMGKNKMNTYIYAPKDDSKHRSNWRSLYTNNELNELKKIVTAANENKVKFVYAISPGVNINFSNYEDELNTLFNKCESIYSLGVKNFAILLDDINSRDYKNHAKLLNDFQSRFIEKHQDLEALIAITPEYAKEMLSSYTDGIAPLLSSKITMMWTGNKVVPGSINSSDLTDINSKMKQKTFIWWNYPVNDYAQRQLFMGPCENLDLSLDKSISGLVSNPMNQGYASLIPLFTISEYLWNPSQYNKNDSLLRAIKSFDNNNIEGLKYFIDFNSANVINGNKSSSYVRDLVQKYDNGDKSQDTLNKLINQFNVIIESLKKLKTTGNKNFINEVNYWLDKTINYCQMAVCLFQAEKAYVERKDYNFIKKYQEEFLSLQFAISNNSYIISPDILTPLINNADGRIRNILSLQRKTK